MTILTYVLQYVEKISEAAFLRDTVSFFQIIAVWTFYKNLVKTLGQKKNDLTESIWPHCTYFVCLYIFNIDPKLQTDVSLLSQN